MSNKSKKKNIFQRILRNKKGISILGFIIFASAASLAYMLHVQDLLPTLGTIKRRHKLNMETRAFLDGLLDYTIFAVQERWCMNSYWGKDLNCGIQGDDTKMQDIITNPLNLERFLWGNVTVNAIKDRFFQLTGQIVPEDPGLNKLMEGDGVTFSADTLPMISTDNPMHLLFTNEVKKCNKSVTVKIEKSDEEHEKSQGDESYLLITIQSNAKTNLSVNCSAFEGTAVRALVAFYPRTLNQFSLILGGDLNIRDLAKDVLADTGNPESKGIIFKSPVYVEKDLIVPAKPAEGAEPQTLAVLFKDYLVIGAGQMYREIGEGDTELYTPLDAGTDTLFSSAGSFLGIIGGVRLDFEADMGLPILFDGQPYELPEGFDMPYCQSRHELETNMSKTAGSRLFIKGSWPDYVLGLSAKNEFREYSYYQDASSGDYTYASLITGQEHNFLFYEMTGSSTVKPVLGMFFSLNNEDPSTNTRIKAYLGRASELYINLANPTLLEEVEDNLEKIDPISSGPFNLYDPNVLPQEVRTATISDTATTSSINLADHFTQVATQCTQLSDNDWFVKECKRVVSITGGTKNCSTTATPTLCNDAQAAALAALSDFEDHKGLLKDAVEDFKDDPPKIKINTTNVWSSKVGLNFELENSSKISSPFLVNVDQIAMNIVAYDFGVSKGRTAQEHMPGPNNSEFPNVIYLTLDKSGTPTIVPKLATLTTTITENADTRITENNGVDAPALCGQNNYEGWSLLRPEDCPNSEPPYVEGEEGSEVSVPLPKNDADPESNDPPQDSATKDEECDYGSIAEEVPDWDISFTANTKYSWMYNLTRAGVSIENPAEVEPLPMYDFPEPDMSAQTYQGVPTRAIVDRCVVREARTFIFGFYVCNKLEFEPRTLPINIVGTIIAGELIIPDEAFDDSPINFMSIWHEDAIAMMKVPGNPTGSDAHLNNCAGFNVPVWYKDMTAGEMETLTDCSPMKFVFSGADNFNWTTVDPEVGFSDLSGVTLQTSSKIKNRYRRYQAVVLSRKEVR